MKKLLLLCTMIFFCNLALIAQDYTKGSLTLTNNKTVEGAIAINYPTETIALSRNNQVVSYSFDQITSVNINNRILNKIRVADIPYFAAPLEDGNASLYQINESQYLVTTKSGKSQVIDLENDRARIPGILSVLFEDCNSIRRSLNAVGDYTEPALLRNVQAYNVCEYQIYAPTPKEIDAAASYNTDFADFYIGIGTGLASISFFDADNSESINSLQFQLGLDASPSFFGPIQGNLYFLLEANAAFAGDKTFSNISNDVNFKLNSYRLLFGLEYQFNKEGNLRPFVGASVGPTGDYYEGSIDGNEFDISGGNAIFVPRIGVKYIMKNNDKIGITVSYITSYENDLTFPTEDEVIPLIVNVETFTLGINYYF